MINREYMPRYTYNYSNPLTKAVKYLIIINTVIFGLLLFSGIKNQLYYYFGLIPAIVFPKFYIWQFITYMFLHGGFFHLLLNMFVLWMFGTRIERTMGSRRFLIYYFVILIGYFQLILIPL